MTGQLLNVLTIIFLPSSVSTLRSYICIFTYTLPRFPISCFLFSLPSLANLFSLNSSVSAAGNPLTLLNFSIFVFNVSRFGPVIPSSIGSIIPLTGTVMSAAVKSPLLKPIALGCLISSRVSPSRNSSNTPGIPFNVVTLTLPQFKNCKTVFHELKKSIPTISVVLPSVDITRCISANGELRSSSILSVSVASTGSSSGLSGSSPVSKTTLLFLRPCLFEVTFIFKRGPSCT